MCVAAGSADDAVLFRKCLCFFRVGLERTPGVEHLYHVNIFGYFFDYPLFQ